MSVDPAVIVNHLLTIAGIISDISVVVGISLILSGIFTLKRYGQTRTFMSQQMSFARPGMLLLAGAMFLVLPTTIGTILNSFWLSANPLNPDVTGDWAGYVQAIVVFVRIIGIVSIMRGLMLISRSGSQGGQPGIVGRAMVHLFGGMMAVHIIGFVHLMKSIVDVV